MTEENVLEDNEINEIDDIESEEDGNSNTKSKSEKFKEIAPKRMREAIKKIRLIGNLSSKSYEFEPKQVAKMMETLELEVSNVRKLFESMGAKEEVEFSFDD